MRAARGPFLGAPTVYCSHRPRWRCCGLTGRRVSSAREEEEERQITPAYHTSIVASKKLALFSCALDDVCYTNTRYKYGTYIITPHEPGNKNYRHRTCSPASPHAPHSYGAGSE
jgi:hypothetical protein